MKPRPFRPWRFIEFMTMADKEMEVASSEKRKKVINRLFGKGEKFPVVEIPHAPEIPPEIEKAQGLSQGSATQFKKPVTDDQNGQVLVSPAGGQSVKIVLPLTEEEIKTGLTHQVIDSFRWLAEWCVRLAKKVGIFIKPEKRKRIK